MNVVRRIQEFNAGRDPERLAMKYRAMRSSTFAFMRGSCHLFYERLDRRGIFASAPAVWVCGDLHLENFGSYKADNRLVHFDINDFDEAVLAPASWDLVRLLASVAVGVDGLGLDAHDSAALSRYLLDAYVLALAAGKAYWVERETAQGLVRGLLDGLQGRARPAFLDSRSTRHGGKRRLLVDGRKALPASAAQRDRVVAFVDSFARAQPDPAFFEVLDVARRIAGTGSLGVERWVILVRGKGSPDGNYLLDLKQALPSSLLPHLRVAQPKWQNEAQRVVALQQRMQAVTMAFLHAVVIDGRPFVLRGLQPSEDRIALARAGPSRAELLQLMATLGRIVAWAQLRSAGREGSASADLLIAFAARRTWQPKLLAAAADMAARVRKDAATFNAACDDGAFGR